MESISIRQGEQWAETETWNVMVNSPFVRTNKKSFDIAESVHVGNDDVDVSAEHSSRPHDGKDRRHLRPIRPIEEKTVCQVTLEIEVEKMKSELSDPDRISQQTRSRNSN